jgi:hypothetical protein
MMKNINIVVILFWLTSQIQAQDSVSKSDFGIKSVQILSTLIKVPILFQPWEKYGSRRLA